MKLREEEHKIEMWESCLVYLFSNVQWWLAVSIYTLLDIMIIDERFRASIPRILKEMEIWKLIAKASSVLDGSFYV